MSNPTDGDEPFLSRWSRRKRGVAMEPQQPAGDETRPAAGEPASGSLRSDSGSRRDEDVEIDLSKLPKVEELDERSDIKGFLDMRVPAALRNAALARMWTLDPTIRGFIEVAENQWNWNVPGGAPFYEEIAGCPEIAESIVQGGGSVLREVIGGAAAGDEPHTLVEHNGLPTAASHSVEEPGGADAATQHPQTSELDAHVPNPSAESAPLHSDATLQADADVEHADAAAQQSDAEPEVQSVVRRRHGGALPA